MTAPDGYAVPACLRGARFVPRQHPAGRSPARVTPGAFLAAGVPLPDDPARWNACQLSRRRGWPWSETIDRHTGRRGAELLGCGALILVDIDMPAAVDGTPLVNSARWLADRAAEAGELLDMSAAVAVRTPGHPESGHLPGWHLWYRARPGAPVQAGALEGFRHIELKDRGTCPGSPGYDVRHAPRDLPELPQWISALARKPRPATTVTGSVTRGSARGRLDGIVSRLADAGPGDHRRNLLYWSACRVREMAAAGEIDPVAAVRELYEAAEICGLVAKRGACEVRRTIADGLRSAAAA